MSTAENKAILDRFNVALNEGNLDAVDVIFAPDFVGHSPLSPEPIQGPSGYKAFLATMVAAMPDLHFPRWTLIADGDLVAIHMEIEGTFTNELMGYRRTARRYPFGISTSGGSLMASLRNGGTAWTLWGSCNRSAPFLRWDKAGYDP